MDRRLLVLLVTVGCAETGATDLVAPPPPPPVETTTARLEECGGSELWVTDIRGGYGLDPRTPWFVDAQGLVARGRAVYFMTTTFLRKRDGTVVIAEGADYVSVDASRRVAVAIDREVPSLVSFADGARLASLGDKSVIDAALLPSGDRAVTLDGFDEAALDVWEVANPVAPIRHYRLGVAYFERIDAIVGDRVFLAGADEVIVVDLGTDEVIRSPKLTTEEHELVADVVPSRDGARIAVTTTRGRILELDAHDFAPLAPERAGRVVRVNEQIFAPLIEVVPVAWSNDGALFAYLRDDGQLVVERDGEVFIEIAPRPTPRETLIEGPTHPVNIAFSADDANLALQYEYEFAMHGCPIEGATEDAEVALLADEVARVDAPVTLTAAHDLGVGLVGHHFSVGGEAVAPASTVRSVEWTPREAGTFEIELVVDDGLRRGTARRTIEVRP